MNEMWFLLDTFDVFLYGGNSMDKAEAFTILCDFAEGCCDNEDCSDYAVMFKKGLESIKQIKCHVPFDKDSYDREVRRLARIRAALLSDIKELG